nr:hypothetical protein [Tanacetum cinerariifolium]
MTSFGYRLNPRYAIKECSSCGTLYTRDCSCSKGSVEDKILVPKPPKNCARCARCGHPINGPYCQGCTLLREKLKEDLVTYFQNFQNTSESSDGSTNVVNAPRELFVVKQDHGVNPPHIDECCCECGEALDGIICQQCACKSCGKGAHIGYNCPPKVPIISNPEPCNRTMNNEPPQILLSFDPMFYFKNSSPCVSKPNFIDDSSNIFNPPPQPPIYSCEFCLSNVQYGHYCIPQAPFINPEPGYSQDFNFPQDIHDFQQQYLCCDQCGGPHETFQCQQVISYGPCYENCGGLHENFQCQLLNYYEPNPTYDSNYSGFDQFGDLHPQQDLCCDNCEGLHETSQCQPMNQNLYNSNSSGFDQTQPPQFPVIHPPPQETSIEISHDQENELAEFINSPGWNHPAVYDNDDDDVDYTIAITPVLSTEEPDNSLSMGNEHLDTIPTTESDEVINDDDSLYYEIIEYVEASPHDSKLVSLEVEKIVIPKDEEIEDDNLQFENFCFDLEEISSGSTTTHSDISLSEYEAFSFYDDNIEEISSDSTTTQSDISLLEYDSFIFDLLIDQFPPSDRSDFTHEEFGDKPAHIISPPEYDCFYFRNLPDLGELISSLNSGIRENLSSTTYVNLPVEDDYSPLLAYVVWIFLAYLTFLVIPPHVHSFGNEDTIFDPGITINRFSFKPGLSHRCRTFKKFNTHRSHLNESPIEMLFSTLFLMDQ